VHLETKLRQIILKMVTKKYIIPRQYNT